MSKIEDYFCDLKTEADTDLVATTKASKQPTATIWMFGMCWCWYEDEVWGSIPRRDGVDSRTVRMTCADADVGRRPTSLDMAMVMAMAMQEECMRRTPLHSFWRSWKLSAKSSPEKRTNQESFCCSCTKLNRWIWESAYMHISELWHHLVKNTSLLIFICGCCALFKDLCAKIVRTFYLRLLLGQNSFIIYLEHLMYVILTHITCLKVLQIVKCELSAISWLLGIKFC